jgi:hypothetical protein
MGRALIVEVPLTWHACWNFELDFTQVTSFQTFDFFSFEIVDNLSWTTNLDIHKTHMKKKVKESIALHDGPQSH